MRQSIAIVRPVTGRGEGLAGWIALHGEPVIVPNSLEDPRVTHIPGTPRREESMVGAPLVFEDRVADVFVPTGSEVTAGGSN